MKKRYFLYALLILFIIAAGALVGSKKALTSKLKQKIIKEAQKNS